MYILFKRHKQAEHLYTVMGKALTICQRFEESVKFVMNGVLSSHGYNMNKINLDAIFDVNSRDHKKIFNLTLGNRLKHPWLIETVYFNDENLKVLTEGKEARNYLCHESTLSFSFGFDLIESYKSVEDYLLIKQNIDKLCKAFVLISEFHYQIQEKEPSQYTAESYMEQLKEWIFINDPSFLAL